MSSLHTINPVSTNVLSFPFGAVKLTVLVCPPTYEFASKTWMSYFSGVWRRAHRADRPAAPVPTMATRRGFAPEEEEDEGDGMSEENEKSEYVTAGNSELMGYLNNRRRLIRYAGDVHGRQREGHCLN